MPDRREQPTAPEWPQTDQAIQVAVRDGTLLDRLVAALATKTPIDSTYLPHLRAVLDASIAEIHPQPDEPLPQRIQAELDKFVVCHAMVRDLDNAARLQRHFVDEATANLFARKIDSLSPDDLRLARRIFTELVGSTEAAEKALLRYNTTQVDRLKSALRLVIGRLPNS